MDGIASSVSYGPMRQTCKACGRQDKFDFSVPDDVWASVVRPELVNRVVCLACFDEFAREKGVDYAGALTTLFFAGDRAVFVFKVESFTSVRV
jgi:hypothetical protein